MADYGRQAQVLDQTFPERLISATANDKLDEDELKERMSQLDIRTDELRSLGFLDEKAAHPFDIQALRDMDDWQAQVMTLYVRDIEDKLKALGKLAERAQLLLDNINGKFQNKKIYLDRKEGLVAKDTGGQKLPLESLSSGEQHELVLHYNLLFRVPSNTVVLIDEPELSLHVAWQKKFLSDLEGIINLSGFDAIVATHSPFIAGDKDDLMVRLGEPP